MREFWKRRSFLQTAGLGVLIGSAGCSTSSFQFDEQSITGTVVDLDGDRITDATVDILQGREDVISSTTTDERGEFGISSDAPTWLRVTHSDHAPRMQAVAPGDNVRIQLPSSDETVTFSFGGDVMFGRRFYEDNEDSLSTSFQIDPDDRLQDHKAILNSTEPLLGHADITSVNLESPLTTTDWRHPEKEYTFVSHPVAARALADAGVTYTALGNNHVFDALTPGMEETVEALTDAGIGYSGAGFSSEEAWEPTILERNGTTVAMLSCTTVFGYQNEISWSTDRNESEIYAVKQNNDVLEIPGSVGVAEAREDRIREEVTAATQRADLVVLQIHGGEDYQRTPTEDMRTLTEAASEAGADMVINHHPHVTGGLEYINETLVAWSLGNLVFDQVLWETLRSYVLTVQASPEGVLTARIDPIILPEYVPIGVTGEPNRKIQWETAGLSDTHFSLSGGDLEYTRHNSETSDDTEVTRHVEGSADLYMRQSGTIQNIEDVDGVLRAGEDQLLTSEFGDYTIDDQRYTGPLWRVSRRELTVGPDVGYEDSPGVQLSRNHENEAKQVLTPQSRIPVQSDALTLTGLYRFTGETGLELLISWFDELSGSSLEQESQTLDGTDGDWERVRLDLTPPSGSTYVDVFFRLSPPDSGLHQAAFDDVRLIEWADNAVAGREYDHLEIDGSGSLTFTARDRDNVRWETLDGSRSLPENE